MPEDTLTPAQALLRSVPGRAARELNEWAHGLREGNPQQLVLERLAESLEGVGDLMESRPDGVVAVFCLKTHDLLTSAVESALEAKFPGTFSSSDQETPIDDRDDAYYLADSRIGDVLPVLRPTHEDDKAPTT